MILVKKGYKQSEEHKRKKSESLKGRKLSEETRRKISVSHKMLHLSGKIQSRFKKGNKIWLGKKHSEETKRKMSLAQSGRKFSEETRRKISVSHKMLYSSGKIQPPMKGKKHSEETRRKISLAHKGRKFSEEYKSKMSQLMMGEKNPFYGKHHTEETRRKMRGKKHSEETMRKMSLARIGKKHSEETRRKMRGKRDLSEEVRRKMSKNRTGKKHSVETKRKISLAHKGRKLSEEHKSKMRGKKFSEEHKRNLGLAQIGNKKALGSIRSVETRKKIREKRLQQVIPIKDTKFELSVQALLTEKGIEFEKHKPILGQPDLFIEPNICIFCDGDFYHANPAKYSDDFIMWKERISKSSGKHKPAITAKMIREKDERVNKELRVGGYKLERIWYTEFMKDPEKCIQEIIKIVKESRR